VQEIGAGTIFTGKTTLQPFASFVPECI